MSGLPLPFCRQGCAGPGVRGKPQDHALTGSGGPFSSAFCESHAGHPERRGNSKGRKPGRFPPSWQPHRNVGMSAAGFHSPGEKRVLHEFINEFSSQLMNVYVRRS